MTIAEPDTPLDRHTAPKRGTTAYRLLLLEAFAPEEYNAFVQAIGRLWPVYGPRLLVDCTVEALRSIARAVPPGHPLRDPYGRVPMDQVVVRQGPEAFLSTVLVVAEKLDSGLTPQERFAQAVADGESVEFLTDQLVPVWQGALDAMEDPGRDLEVEVAAGVYAAVKRHAEHADISRGLAAQQATTVTHALLRAAAFPAGKTWVGAWAREGPDERLTAQAVHDNELYHQARQRVLQVAPHVRERYAALVEEDPPVRAPRP